MKIISALKSKWSFAMIVSLVVGFLAVGQAQAGNDNFSSFWFMSLTRFKLNHNIRAFIDIQPRNVIDSDIPDAEGSMRQLLLRGAVGYEFHPGFTLFLGYANIKVHSPRRIEDRWFEELLARTKLGRWGVMHRVRFEQRSIDGVAGTPLRGRYFIRLTRPFATNRKLALAISEEVFVNLNSKVNGPQAGFDQNRLFLGLNYKLNQNLGLDVGYQNQYINRRNGSPNRMNHILFLGLLSNFDLENPST